MLIVILQSSAASEMSNVFAHVRLSFHAFEGFGGELSVFA